MATAEGFANRISPSWSATQTGWAMQSRIEVTKASAPGTRINAVSGRRSLLADAGRTAALGRNVLQFPLEIRLYGDLPAKTRYVSQDADEVHPDHGTHDDPFGHKSFDTERAGLPASMT